MPRSDTNTLPLNPRLVGLDGALEGRVFEIGQEPFTVGRQSANRLQLRHKSVSRHHCQVQRRDTEILLQDLDSSRGSFVNGVPVRERLLQHGDYVKIGDALFLFLLESEDPSVTPVSISSVDGAWTAESTIQLPLSESRQPTRHLAALLKISTAVHEARSTKKVAGCLIDLVFEVAPAERVAVFLVDDEELILKQSAQRPQQDRPQQDRPQQDYRESFDISHKLARRAMAERVAVLSQDVTDDAALQSVESLHAAQIRSLICIPLVAFGRPLGVVWVDARRRHRRFDKGHLELLTAASAVTAVALDNAHRVEWLQAEAERLRSAELEHEMVGESPAMNKLLDLVARVAPTDLTVLAVGESGTGKELVAQAIHLNSPRAKNPFVAVNCATLSETLLESELFGHERGAFTNAVARKQGKFELAHKGTLFLDEVGEIPMTLQAKLLRALETLEFERVGGTRTIRVDLRIVAATNRDLEEAISAGTFRRDLYHRLNVFSLNLPPLRNRPGDVALLASHFAARVSRRLQRELSGFTPEARACLESYDWPGNIRELKNAVERAAVLSADGLVRPEDLPESVLEKSAEESIPGDSYHVRVNQAKRKILLAAIRAADGKLHEAAELLGLNRTYLHRLVSNLELRDELEK